MLDEVLDLFDRGRAAQTLTGQLHAFGDALDLDRRHARVLLCGGVCLGDGGDDLDDVELDLRAVSFDDLHGWQLSSPDFSVGGADTHYILWRRAVLPSKYSRTFPSLQGRITKNRHNIYCFILVTSSKYCAFCTILTSLGSCLSRRAARERPYKYEKMPCKRRRFLLLYRSAGLCSPARTKEAFRRS